MSASVVPAMPQPATFPGQAAAPTGPCDLLPMYLMHHAFRRDLRAFQAAVAATPATDRRTWRALSARWQGFARVLHHHHSGEDRVLWPLLLERVDACGDAEGRALLTAMEAEHDDIDPLLRACAEGFAQLADATCASSREALVVRVAATRELIEQHLAHEESGAMALLQAHLTQDEWHALDREFAKDYKPAAVLFALPWVLHALPPAMRPAVHAFIGRPALTLWRAALRARFERAERRAFRYLPDVVEPAADRLTPALVAALGVLVTTDLVGGLLDVAADRSTLRSAWNSAATLCAPWPMIAFQVIAVLFAVNGGRRTARVAAALLALACAVSVASGFFDGQLARADLTPAEVGFQAWLLAVTAVLGGTAAAVAVRSRSASAGR
jgi:hypothetical protein